MVGWSIGYRSILPPPAQSYNLSYNKNVNLLLNPIVEKKLAAGYTKIAMKKQKTMQNQGFALIAFIIVLAIIAIWAAIYFKSGGGSGDKNIIQTGNRAIDQAKQENGLMQQEGVQNQDMLNSLDNPAPANDHGAINQAKNAAAQQTQSQQGY